ncbi:MAG: type II toxin-antitoxin system VapC family toxin [Candidatus Omnitrophota bacterium]
MLIFLDTCVFEYAQGRDNIYKDPCLKILEAVLENKVIPYTDTEIFQEIWYRHYHRDTDQGINLLKDVLQIIKPGYILPVTHADFSLAVHLGEIYGRFIEPRDAIHIAVMLNNSIHDICTADTGIAKVKEVTVIDPINFVKKLL